MNKKVYRQPQMKIVQIKQHLLLSNSQSAIGPTATYMLAPGIGDTDEE